MRPSHTSTFGAAETGLPKVPEALWRDIVQLFKYCAYMHKEATVQLLYDRNARAYEVYVPEQWVTAVNCFYGSDELMFKLAYNQNLKLVCDFHSHHSMPPEYSLTDARDEVRDQLYAIWGSFHGDSYAITLRKGSKGKYIRIPAEDFFEGYDGIDRPTHREIPADWIRRIKIK